MATGGPFTQQARTGVDIEGAMASATAPAMAIVGADQATDTTTRRTPQVPMEGGGGAQFSLGVDAPMYGWSLSQQDMGQGDVQQIRTDNFVTPVAEKRFGYGAAASRNDAIAKRRAQLEDAKAKASRDFDPFKGISDPAAQHQVAFSNYLNKNAWPSFVQGVQDSLGLTREAAIDYIANDPQGRLMTRQWAQQQDAVAKESAGMTDRSLDILARIAQGKTELPREDQEAILRYVNNVGEADTPQAGQDVSEFLWNARNANEAMSLVQFQDQFLSDFDTFAMQRMQVGEDGRVGEVRRLPGGRYEITDEELSMFEPYKEAMIEQAVELGVKGGNREAIKTHIDRLINNKVERKTRGWNAPRQKGGGQGAGNTGVGTTVRADFRPLNVGTNRENTVYFTPFQKTGDKEHTIKDVSVSSGEGVPDTRIRDISLAYHPGRKDWVLMGRSLNETGKKELERVSASSRDFDSPEGGEEIDRIWKAYSTQIGVPAKVNSSVVETLWGDADPTTAVAKIIGVSPEEVAQMVTTEDGRAQIAQKMGVPVPSQKKATAKAPANAPIEDLLKLYGE